jgi:mannose-1-phosphate guanylyltransferase
MPVHGRPLLEYWLRAVDAAHISHVAVNLHHLKDEVSRFLSRPIFSRWVEAFVEDELLGTAGSVRLISEGLPSGTVLVLHADNWTHCDLRSLLRYHKQAIARGMLMTMMTFDTDTPKQCGIVKTDADGTLQAFYEKYPDPPGNRANGAVYVLEPAVINWLREHPEVSDFSTGVIPEFFGRIACWHYEGIHRDIGTPQALVAAQADPAHPLRPDTIDDWQQAFEKHSIHQMIRQYGQRWVEAPVRK